MKTKSQKQITGIIGYPLSHTLSPLMHNAGFKKFGLSWEYRVFETKPGNVKKFIDKIREEAIKGINVTIPHKHAVMPFLDKIDKAAKTIGAVNTIVNKKGFLTGYNTDYLGFIASLKKHKVNLKNKNVVMIGAGGAAHAVGYAINSFKPRSFYIYNIDIPMINRLVKKLKIKNVKTGDIKKTAEKDKIFAQADFIINATSVGMHDNNMPYELGTLKKGCVVYDLIYNPPLTKFLKHARSKGTRILNGLDMLIYQGIEAFYLWTGKRPAYGLYKNAIKRKK
jgi:shikimate dehydrogenase